MSGELLDNAGDLGPHFDMLGYQINREKASSTPEGAYFFLWLVLDLIVRWCTFLRAQLAGAILSDLAAFKH